MVNLIGMYNAINAFELKFDEKEKVFQNMEKQEEYEDACNKCKTLLRQLQICKGLKNCSVFDLHSPVGDILANNIRLWHKEFEIGVLKFILMSIENSMYLKNAYKVILSREMNDFLNRNLHRPEIVELFIKIFCKISRWAFLKKYYDHNDFYFLFDHMPVYQNVIPGLSARICQTGKSIQSLSLNYSQRSGSSSFFRRFAPKA